MKTYAGIGSRETPSDVLNKMAAIAEFLSSLDYTLRSGGAAGADSAFESGATRKEIFLPWDHYNGRKVNNVDTFSVLTEDHFTLAEAIHPAWDRCSHAAKRLHARNTQQILGRHLDSPCDFVVCWTKGGQTVGGTGLAIRLAKCEGIRIFNLGTAAGFDEFLNFCETLASETPASETPAT